MTDEQLVDYMIAHEDLLVLALSKCFIYRTSANFDDCMQIARLAFLDAGHSFQRNFKTEKDFDAFRGYAYRRIRWKVLDAIRKEQPVRTYSVALTDELSEYVSEPTALDFEASILLEELIDKVKEEVTDEDRELINELVYEQLTISEIAARHNVSRQTIYNRRKKVQTYFIKEMHLTV